MHNSRVVRQQTVEFCGRKIFSYIGNTHNSHLVVRQAYESLRGASHPFASCVGMVYAAVDFHCASVARSIPGPS